MFLSELHVIKGKDDKVVLNSSEGQIVTIGGQRFHLLIALKVGRHFKVWMRDTSTEKVYVAMAREIEEVSTVPSSSSAIFEATRINVHFICVI